MSDHRHTITWEQMNSSIYTIYKNATPGNRDSEIHVYAIYKDVTHQ